MYKFKVGDRVKVVVKNGEEPIFNDIMQKYVGKTGIVMSVKKEQYNPYVVSVQFEWGVIVNYDSSNLEKVEEKVDKYFKYENDYGYFIVKQATREGFSNVYFAGTVVSSTLPEYTVGQYDHTWFKHCFCEVPNPFINEEVKKEGTDMQENETKDRYFRYSPDNHHYIIVKYEGEGEKRLEFNGTVVASNWGIYKIGYKNSDWIINMFEEIYDYSHPSPSPKQVYICAYKGLGALYSYYEGNSMEEAYEKVTNAYGGYVDIKECKFYQATPINVEMKLEVK